MSIVRLPCRWVGHGIDVRAVHVDEAWFFPAADVRQALKLQDVSVPPSVVAELASGDLIDLYSVDAVRIILDFTTTSELLTEFSGWFESLVGWLQSDRVRIVRSVTGTALPEPPGVTLEQASRDLNNDPMIRVRTKGQLYDELERLHWCTRTSDGRRIPSEPARLAKLLTSRGVSTPAGIRQQVLILPAGLAKLRWELIHRDTAAGDVGVPIGSEVYA